MQHMTSDAFMLACVLDGDFSGYIFFTLAEPKWPAAQSLSEVLAEAKEADNACRRFQEICEKLGLTTAVEYDSDSDSSLDMYNYHRGVSDTLSCVHHSITLRYHSNHFFETDAGASTDQELAWSLQCGALAAAEVYAALRDTATRARNSSTFFTWDCDARELEWHRNTANPRRAHIPSQAVVRDLIEAHARDFAAEGLFESALRSRGICRQDAIGWLWQRVPWLDAWHDC